MDITPLLSLFNQNTFSVVCCCVLFYLTYKQNEQHRQAEKNFLECLNNNTRVMEKLTEIIEKHGLEV